MLSRGCPEVNVQGSTKRHVVLVLAGMGLIFFISACTELCFGFVTTTVLLTHWCFRYSSAVLAQHHGILLFTLPQQQAMWRCTSSWEGTQPGQLIKGMSHTVWCVMLSSEGWEGSLPGLLLLWELAGHQSAGGEQLGFFASPVFLGFVLFALFSFIYYTVFISASKFSNFCPYNCLFHPYGRIEQVAM